MGDAWYVGQGQDRRGPFTTAQLREMAASGELKPDSLIWRQGMVSWVVARTAKNLFLQDGPPPLPAADDGPPPLPIEPKLAPFAATGEAGPRPGPKTRRRTVERSRGRHEPKKGFWGAMFDHKLEEAWTGGQMAVLVIGSLLVGVFGVLMGIVGLSNKARRIQGGVLLAIGALGVLLAVGGVDVAQEGGYLGGGSGASSGGHYSAPQSLPAGVDDPDLWAQVLRAYPHASRQEQLAMYQMLLNAKIQRRRERAIREMYAP